ncbi:MAG: hypothetical protein ACW96X_07870, partial [Promethearchaeota archaeon]
KKDDSISEPAYPPRKIGWLFVGRRKATLGYIRQHKFIILREFSLGNSVNHIPGRDSSQIKVRLLKEAEMAFHRRISEVMNETFLEFKDLQRIFVGGSASIEEKIVKNDIIDYRLEGKITFIEVSSDEEGEGIQEFFGEVRKILSK